MPLIFGIDTIALDPTTTKGVVPVGTVLSVMSDIAGSFTVPASGVVDGGFMLCDGVAIPGGNPLSGNTPNMTGDVYLRGSTVAGNSGGANTKTLNTPQLPSHSHSASSGTANAPHGHSASPNGGVNAPANAPHHHKRLYANSSAGIDIADRVSVFRTQSPFHYIYGEYANAPHNQPHNTPAGNVPGANAPHSHPISVTSTGSGDSFDIQPNYITCQYIIRVA